MLNRFAKKIGGGAEKGFQVRLSPAKLVAAPPALVLFDVWEDAENITNRTVKAPPKTGQNAAPGGISRPHLALRGTTWHKINPYM